MPKSILYVLPPELPVSFDAVGGIQQTALGNKLPFAVVYQLRERTTDLDAKLLLLKEAESSLGMLHIPLILLLGPSEPILESLVRHADAAVHTVSPTAVTPRDHPYHWPGNVRSIAELQPIIDQMTGGEQRTFC